MSNEKRTSASVIGNHNIEKPTIRIIYHMARSGGTLISKCLAVMNNVVLLSEVHPFGNINPIAQANKWFHLLTKKDLSYVKRSGGLTFFDAISLIEERCRKKGNIL